MTATTLALEALKLNMAFHRECSTEYTNAYAATWQAIAALEAEPVQPAPQQAAQEPVAWMLKGVENRPFLNHAAAVSQQEYYRGGGIDTEIITLIAAPQPAPQVVQEPVDGTKGLAQFAEWFRKNYPGPDTIIHDPMWHAPKIFRAATQSLQAKLDAQINHELSLHEIIASRDKEIEDVQQPAPQQASQEPLTESQIRAGLYRDFKESSENMRKAYHAGVRFAEQERK